MMTKMRMRTKITMMAMIYNFFSLYFLAFAKRSGKREGRGVDQGASGASMDAPDVGL